VIIKAKPEDFKVQEIASLPLAKRGAFSVYLLEKRGWNTVDALREISKNSKVPSKLFSYGGKKDRHAWTSQFVAIEGPRIKDISSDQLTLTFQGYMDRPMGPDLIEGNRFEVIVRQLANTTAQEVLLQLKNVQAQGFPNYFDDQRFGSFDADQGFLAEKILLGHFNGAVKIYLTSIYSGDPKTEKERKSFFLQHWKDWKACASCAYTEFEKYAFEELKKGEKANLSVLNQVPKEDLSMCFSAFQSFLWNEVASKIIRQKACEELMQVKGVTGDYIFYKNVPSDQFDYLCSLTIPTAAHNSKMPDDFCAQIYMGILESRGVKTALFNKLKIRRAFFKATERSLVVFPSELAADVLEDEIYPGKMKVALKFVLPRGSYATMLIKRLFNASL
jgi:tRNA pseudouridine13 synthase